MQALGKPLLLSDQIFFLNKMFSLSPPQKKTKNKTKKKKANRTKQNIRAKNNDDKNSKKKRFQAYNFHVNPKLYQYLLRGKRGTTKRFYCIVPNSQLKLGANAEIVFFSFKILRWLWFCLNKSNQTLRWLRFGLNKFHEALHWLWLFLYK